MMTILVTQGPSHKKEFRIYRGVLCFHSEFFNRALNGTFSEGGSDFYEVKNCTIKTFEIFYDWMNTSAVGEMLWGEQIIELFVFADFYAILALKNRAVESFFRGYLSAWKVYPSKLKLIHTTTAEKSTLRKLAVDLAVHTWARSSFGLTLAKYDLPVEIILDLFQGVIDTRVHGGPQYGYATKPFGMKGWKDYMRRYFCNRYHEHISAEHRSGNA